MGTYGNGNEKQKKATRGSTNNAGRLAAFAQGRQGGDADWSKWSAGWLVAVVTAITLRGGAVTFSLSRDGGAYGLRLMLDGDHQQLWFNGDADVDAELERVVAVLDALPGA